MELENSTGKLLLFERLDILKMSLAYLKAEAESLEIENLGSKRTFD